MHAQPYFTVVMPLYNHENYVGAAIDSVLNQSFTDFELVICNDGSTDRSGEIAESYRDARIRVVHKPNGGTATALNTCLLKAQGRYICWLSSDDLFAPHKLRTHHRHHEAHPESTFSLTPYGFMDMAGQNLRAGEQLRPEMQVRLVQFLYGNYVSGLSICADKKLFDLYGVFDDRYHCAQDVDRWLHFFRHQVPTFLGGETQTFTRTGTGHEENAGPFGVLDVIKVLSNQILRFGIAALVPRTGGNTSTTAFAAVILEHLFNPKNIFFQYQLQEHLAGIVYHSGQRLGLKGLYQQALADLQNRPQRTAELEVAIGVVRSIVAQLDMGGSQPVLSLVEALVQLKNNVSSPEHRELFQKYLLTGF